LLTLLPKIQTALKPSGLSQLEKLTQKKGNGTMTNKSIKKRLVHLPELTEAEREEAKALVHMPDEQIDYTDIPELSQEQFAKGERGKFYRPIKKQLTIRIDADILFWLKQSGEGYQTRLNAILRRAMLSESKATNS
jgi:uncharacterized protein (DUF4415 family)